MIRPTDLIPSIPNEGVVRRVEPQSESKEFGDKDEASGKKRHKNADTDEESMQDTVDVSEQYLSTAHDDIPMLPDLADGVPSKDDEKPRHLDIQV